MGAVSAVAGRRYNPQMQRFLIIATNCALLVLLLIGLPAATHLQLGDWQLSSVSTSRRLLFWALAIAAAGNILGALWFVKGPKAKVLCWEWAAVFGGLLLAAYGYRHGYLNFEWLRRGLLWVQNHF
jgi:hypothetical protein